MQVSTPGIAKHMYLTAVAPGFLDGPCYGRGKSGPRFLVTGGGNFMTTRGNTVIDESQGVGGYVASKRTPVQAMLIDESQEVGGL
mgnify:CR=1 FL=1